MKGNVEEYKSYKVTLELTSEEVTWLKTFTGYASLAGMSEPACQAVRDLYEILKDIK